VDIVPKSLIVNMSVGAPSQ